VARYCLPWLSWHRLPTSSPVMARFSVAAAFIVLVLIGMFGAAANGTKTVLASRLCAGPAQVVGSAPV